jgi:hypothetical protein
MKLISFVFMSLLCLPTAHAQPSPFLAKVEINAVAREGSTGRLLLDNYLRCRNGSSVWEVDGDPNSLLPPPYSLTLKVNTAPFQFCTFQVGPDVYTTPTLTLPSHGFYALRIVDEYGTEIGRQTIVAQMPGKIFSAFDVAGNWYQARTSGSGLILSHERRGATESLFGVWHAFETDGSSSWHSLQNAVWTTPNRVSGTLYRTTGGNCAANPCGNLPSSATQITDIGTFEIEFASETQAVLRMQNREGLISRLDIPLQRLE